jgi:hypothetical protein
MNKIEESGFKFDFLNPDFKTETEGEPVTFFVPPEFQFFLVHKTIDWLNAVNESTDMAFNFETIAVADTTLRGSDHFSVNIHTPAGAGTIYIDYDQENKFKEAELVFLHNVYKNKEKYPDHDCLFRLTIKINNKMEFNGYRLARNVETLDNLSLSIYYDFDRYSVKLRDMLFLIVDDMNKGFDTDLLKLKKENIENTYGFDIFFNTIIDTVLLSPNTFLELNPTFSIKKINNSESFSIFYDELRDLHDKGLLVNLENNLEVVRMAAI